MVAASAIGSEEDDSDDDSGGGLDDDDDDDDDGAVAREAFQALWMLLGNLRRFRQMADLRERYVPQGA